MLILVCFVTVSLLLLLSFNNQLLKLHHGETVHQQLLVLPPAGWWIW